MSRVLLRRLLQSTALLCGVGVLLLLVPMIAGSAEAFPTGEQDEKLRIAAGVLMLLLAAAGGACIVILKRIKP